jgi:methyl-coenzyme M reductase subunit D
MVAESDKESVQVEIFPYRILTPETAQRLLNELYRNGGIIRIMIQGPNMPRFVPYGPGKGTPIDQSKKDRLIEVGDQALELKVKVGRIRLELEGEEYLSGVKAACERTLSFTFQIRRGKFFHDKLTVSGYAKYGKVDDKRLLGLIDPKAKREDRLAILSDEEKTIDEKER